MQRIPVRLAIEPGDAQGMILRAGMSAEVEIDAGKDNSVLGRWFGQGSNDGHARLSR